MPPANTPLYNHPLPEIEAWLAHHGCERSEENLSLWKLARADWSAELLLDVDSIVVNYVNALGKKVQRSFKYSLSRADLEDVIFSGP